MSDFVNEINPQVRAAFTTLESPRATLGDDLGDGTNSVSLTGLTVGQTYVVKGVGGTMTGATLDGAELTVNVVRYATSFKATATSHAVALTAGTATAITVQQITAFATPPPQWDGLSMRGALPQTVDGLAGGNSNYAIGSPDNHRSLTDGVGNLAIGLASQRNLTTGRANVGVGQATHIALTTGLSNTAAGHSSQAAITTGSRNASVGLTSLRNVTTGNDSSALGFAAGAGIAAANYTLSLGSGAGNTGQSDVSGVVNIGTDDTGVGAYTTTANTIALGTPLHSVKCGSVDGETGFWALGVAKAGTATAPASPTYLTVKVDGTVYHLQAGPQPTIPAEIGLAASDETSNLTTGAAKLTFRMPYAMTLTSVRLSVNTAPTGAALIVDVNEGGTSIFSTRPQIDAGSKTSVGSGTPAVISDAALASDAEITIDIDQIGSTVAGKGLKLWLLGTRA